MKVLLVVIDAASPRVVCPAIRSGDLPNLARLVAAGSMHEGSTTIFPSITPAATSSIITGVYPAAHGIAGASWYDEARNEVAYYGDDFWVIAQEGFGAFLRDFLVRLNGDRLLAPTLFETVEQHGRTAGCLNYLVHRGLHSHKVNVPWLLTLLPGVPLTEFVFGPSLLCLGDFVPGRSPSHGDSLQGKSGLLHRFGMDDDATLALLAHLVEQRALPDFTVAYFADNDYQSHKVGPGAALPVIAHVDEGLGRIFDAAGGLEHFLRDTCVIVTSDHGHCEILPERSAAVIELNTLLADFVLADISRGWRDTDELLICPNMRAAQLYLQRPSSELVERVARGLLRDPRVDLIMWRTPLTAPDAVGYTVVGPLGRFAFWKRSSALPDREKSGGAQDQWGTSWEWSGELGLLGLEVRDGIVDSSSYPNALERIAGVLDARNSGEMWLTATPGCEFEVSGGKAHCGGGSHGALHALDSLSPVIVAGRGAPALPSAIRSVDIAPMCLEILGLPGAYPVGSPRG